MIENKDLQHVIHHVKDCIIDILCHPHNGFEKKEYYAICQLIWMIDKYPSVYINPIRIGLGYKLGDNFIEAVIRFDDDTLILYEEGIERTGMGSDSFERNHTYIPLTTNNKELDIDLETFDFWYNEMQSLLAENKIHVSIENSEPYFVFCNHERNKNQLKNFSPYTKEDLNIDVVNQIIDQITDQGNKIIKYVLNSIIREIQIKGRQTMSFGDDCGLYNLWDEYCIQVQTEQGDMFILQQNYILQLCSNKIDDIKEKAPDQYKALLLYFDAIIKEELIDDLALTSNGVTDSLPDFVLNKLDGIAMNYNNNVIRKYIY